MPDTQEKTVELCIRNEIAEIGTVTQALESFGKDARTPNKAMTQLQIVVDELLSNIIKYAWTPDEPHEIKILLTRHPGMIEIAISDDGIPFDPLQQPARQLQLPGIRPKPGGVGLHLVRQLVDEFKYTRVDGRNQVIVTKRYSA